MKAIEQKNVTGHKATIIAALVTAILGAATTLYIHFDSNGNDIEGTISQISSKAEEDDGKVKPTPSINLTEVFVTPIETKLPSTFYTEITNTGTGKATDFRITIDFGEALPEKCEWVPDSAGKGSEPEGSAIQIITVSQLLKKQSFYIVCNLNVPFFKNITVGGGNIEHEKSLDYDKYKEQRSGEGISFYENLLRVLLSGLLGLLLLKVLIVILN